MVIETDLDYIRRRYTVEQAAAARTDDPIVKLIHETLAGYYSNRLDIDSLKSSKDVIQ